VSALTRGKRKSVGTVVSVKNPAPVHLKRKADQDTAADIPDGHKKKNRRSMGKIEGLDAAFNAISMTVSAGHF